VPCEFERRECAAACCGPRCAPRTLRAGLRTHREPLPPTDREELRVRRFRLDCSKKIRSLSVVAHGQRRGRVGVPNRRHLAKALLRASARQITTTRTKNTLTEQHPGRRVFVSVARRLAKLALFVRSPRCAARGVCAVHIGARSTPRRTPDCSIRKAHEGASGLSRTLYFRSQSGVVPISSQHAPARALAKQNSTQSKDPMCIARDPRAEHP
jgi:hypothetical protein